MQPETYVDNDGYTRPNHPKHVHERMRVYAIRAGTLVKIGVTANLAQRLKQLRAGSPLPLELEMSIVGTHHTEAAAHRILKAHGFHSHGEWFEIDSDQVKWLVDELFCEGLVSE